MGLMVFFVVEIVFYLIYVFIFFFNRVCVYMRVCVFFLFEVQRKRFIFYKDVFSFFVIKIDLGGIVFVIGSFILCFLFLEEDSIFEFQLDFSISQRSFWFGSFLWVIDGYRVVFCFFVFQLFRYRGFCLVVVGLGVRSLVGFCCKRRVSILYCCIFICSQVFQGNGFKRFVNVEFIFMFCFLGIIMFNAGRGCL